MNLIRKEKIDIHSLLYTIKDIKLKKRITFAKSKYWHKIPKCLYADETFIEGFAYYIGDGRTKTDRGLSTVNSDVKLAKFFINWLKTYFNVKIDDIKIHIKVTSLSFNKDIIKKEAGKRLGLNERYITSISRKHGAKKHHRMLYEILINRSILKLIFDLLRPKIKLLCLRNSDLASAYLRGIMAAEGSPKYNVKSSSRQVHLKMKDKREIDYIFSLLTYLGIKSIIYYSKSDNEWLVAISGVYELQKLKEINIFKLTKDRDTKFNLLMSTYKREQVKKGDVFYYYLNKLIEFGKIEHEITAPKLANFMNRDRTRVIKVLRKLQRDGFLSGKRISKPGTPFVFDIIAKGEDLLNNFSK